MQIPLVEEEATVGTRTVETARVKIRKVATAHEQAVEVPPLEAVEVEIERVPVERDVDAPQPVRTEGDVTVIPLHEETVVLTRRLRVTEEVRVRLVRRAQPQPPQRVVLRREELQVDRVPAAAPAASPTNDNDNDKPAADAKPPDDGGAAPQSMSPLEGDAP